MVTKTATICIENHGVTVDREHDIILKLQADVLLLSAKVSDLQTRVANLEPKGDTTPLRDLS